MNKKVEFEVYVETDDFQIWAQGLAKAEILRESCGYFAGVFFVENVSIEEIRNCIKTSRITGVEIENYEPTPEELQKIKNVVCADDKIWTQN